MNNTNAIIRLCAAGISVALLLAYGSYKSLFDVGADTQFIESQVQSDTPDAPEQVKSPESSTTESADKATPSSKTDNTASVTASAKGTVKGEIVERFISPYTANTSYNNVYLKNNTDLNINLKEFVNGSLGFDIEKNSEPQVLIIHTHATESYMLDDRDYYTSKDPSRTTNNEYNMIALGKIVTDKLNEAGITTIHDTTQHDYPSYNESYSRAAETICNYTAKYKSIKIVIDLHRDAIAANDTDKVKVTTEIDGKKAAQIMLVMGSQSGGVTNFPQWKENLKLATKIQQTLEVMYPSLARSIHFMSKNYNESLTTGSVLIEIGTDGNTLDESKYSAELLANALISLFNTL